MVMCAVFCIHAYNVVFTRTHARTRARAHARARTHTLTHTQETKKVLGRGLKAEKAQILKNLCQKIKSPAPNQAKKKNTGNEGGAE